MDIKELIGKRVYLGMPYAHEYEAMEKSRFIQCNCFADWLLNKGLYVFSPISHSDPIYKAQQTIKNDCNPSKFCEWLTLDKTFVDHWSEAMIVPLIYGSEDSEGMGDEIGWHQIQGKPVYSWRPFSIYLNSIE